jgi:transcriptional regulator with XRE-family HTH domain
VNLAGLLRDARHRAGLTQAELAEKSGTSQPTIAAYESGRAVPRLSTLQRLVECSGHDLEISASPTVRRGAAPIANVAIPLKDIAEQEGLPSAWRRLLDFVDDFRGSTAAGQRWLVAEEPGWTGNQKLDAAVAGIVDLLCVEVGIDSPLWTRDPGRVAEPWWFVAGLPGFEAMALRDTPVALALHGVFVNEGAFDRV